MNTMSIDVETAASAAKRLKAGENEREAHSLKEQIEADQYLESKAATATGVKRRGLVIAKFRPPGSI